MCTVFYIVPTYFGAITSPFRELTSKFILKKAIKWVININMLWY